MVKRLLKEPRKMAERVHDGMSGMGRRIAVLKFDASHMCDMRIRRTILVSVYAVFVGIVAGVGAVLFRYMIALAHNLFFNGEFDFVYDSTRHVESPFGWWWALLVPPAGMLVVVFLTRKFAPEAKGHGVPEVMHAILERGGRIRPIVSLVKSLASAICIGSGGSVGREGPIVQIGASFGSTLGQLLGLKPREVITLVCAGVAGGIAATFNAPIGGVAFAFELMLPEISILRLMPLVVGATVATEVSTSVLGKAPAFQVPTYVLVSPWEFAFYAFLGFLAGFASIAYIKTLYAMEGVFDKWKTNPYFKGVLAGLAVAVCGLLLKMFAGHYYIFGVGYSFITDALTGKGYCLWILLALLVAKILANSLTLAGGGSGGVFAPSLFIGIALGSIVGTVVNHLFPSISAPTFAYALVGMAAVVAGTTGAVMTAIIMTFEMTRNYDIMLPLMLSVVIAGFVTRFFYRETIYTTKLKTRGVSVRLDKLVNVLRLTPVREVMSGDIVSIRPGASVDDAISIMVLRHLTAIPVIEGDECLGVVSLHRLYGVDLDDKVEEHLEKMDLKVDAEEDSYNALRKMESNELGFLVVESEGRIVGVCTSKMIVRRYFEKSEMLME